MTVPPASPTAKMMMTMSRGIMGRDQGDEDKDDSLKPWLTRLLIAMGLFAITFTALRMYSRHLNRQKLWWDDWLSALNIILIVASIGLVFVVVSMGLGLHVQYVGAAVVKQMIPFVVAFDVIYIWSLAGSKLSVLLLYYRVFQFGYFKGAAWGLGMIVTSWALAATLLALFLCTPIEKLWFPEVPGHCMSTTVVRLLNSGVSILTDVLILCLPIPAIWSLQQALWTQKIGLTLVFALGFFVVFASSFRIRVLLDDEAVDTTYVLARDAGWTIIEITAAHVSASLPTVAPALFEIGRAILGKKGTKPEQSRLPVVRGEGPDGLETFGTVNNATTNDSTEAACYRLKDTPSHAHGLPVGCQGMRAEGASDEDLLKNRNA